jgi:hypothetical protein
MLDRLELCSAAGGCRFKVQHDEINGRKTNAHVIPTASDGTALAFLAGRPNKYDDYRKDLLVQALDKDMVVLATHKAQVIVTGDYVEGAGKSFALPTYQPIMILRDPPGGLSQASYQNVATSKYFEYIFTFDLVYLYCSRHHCLSAVLLFVAIKVQSSEAETLKDVVSNANVYGGLLEVEFDLCVGLGAAKCDQAVKVKAIASNSTTKSKSYVQKHTLQNIPLFGVILPVMIHSLQEESPM